MIEDTQPSDVGVYACEASVEERKEVAFINVTLSVKCKAGFASSCCAKVGTLDCSVLAGLGDISLTHADVCDA